MEGLLATDMPFDIRDTVWNVIQGRGEGEGVSEMAMRFSRTPIGPAYEGTKF